MILKKASNTLTSIFCSLYSLNLLWKWTEVAQSCQTLCNPMDSQWNSPGQNTGVGSLSLLQGIFPTQESNPGLLHRRWILYQLSYKGSPKIFSAAAAAAKSLQLCPILCNPIDGSPPGSPVPGILQARILEWVAMPSSRWSSQPRDRTQVFCIAGGFFTI